MDRESHKSIVYRQIADALGMMFPYGEGRVERSRAEYFLVSVAAVGFREGCAYGLSNLLDVPTLAGMFGVSARRMRAIAKRAYEQFAVGFRVPSGRLYLFHVDEIESLRPGPPGRPRAKKG